MPLGEEKGRSRTKQEVGNGAATHGSYAWLLAPGCSGLCPALEGSKPLKMETLIGVDGMTGMHNTQACGHEN